jgi:hypothetical protein
MRSILGLGVEHVHASIWLAVLAALAIAPLLTAL